MTHFIGFVLMVLCFDADHEILGGLLAARLIWDATIFIGWFMKSEEMR